MTVAGTPEARARAKAARMRQLQLTEQNRAEVKELTDNLVRSLDRPATQIELLLAETISATIVRGRRLRDRGSDDAAQRRELARLVKVSPWAADAS